MQHHIVGEPLPEYLVIGNVTKDLLPGGGYALGGTATYSAIAALRLGVRVGVMTAVSPELTIFPQIAESDGHLAIQRLDCPETTTFENLYDANGRWQYIRAVGMQMQVEHLPEGWSEIPIVHVGPIAQEVSTALALSFGESLLGVTPQGFFRRWDADGQVGYIEWADADQVLDRADVCVLSMEDLAHDQERLARFVERVPLLVLTRGPEGATVYERGRETMAPGFDVDEVDPTGAGDVFATAFMIRYHETGDAMAAAWFANSAASYLIEGLNTTTIPTREQVEWRIEHGRPR